MIKFQKLNNNINPILEPKLSSFICPVLKKQVLWEEKDVFNPAAVVKDNLVYLLYRAEDRIGSLSGTSRIGLAWSEDGINFQNRLTSPVLYPSKDKFSKYEWDGGCEDPRVIEKPASLGGGYVMTYTSYDGTARLSVATSYDLLNWTKHGPAFGKAFGGSYINAWTKSGSIVVEPQPDGRLVAVKINGYFWMYWGENDLHIAQSTDLINWIPLMTEHPDSVYRGRPDHLDIPTGAKKPLSVLTPRKGKFDSNLVEPGPPAILRPDGILFIYNSKNTACNDNPGHICTHGESDTNLAPGTYSAGQVLFSRDDPTVVLKRTSEPFFKPTEPFEITGQVGNVCFLEGLVFFKGKWLLYYGTADSKIAVAEANIYDYKGLVDQRAKARREAAAASAEEGPDEEVFHLIGRVFGTTNSKNSAEHNNNNNNHNHNHLNNNENHQEFEENHHIENNEPNEETNEEQNIQETEQHETHKEENEKKEIKEEEIVEKLYESNPDEETKASKTIFDDVIAEEL